ncbi:MAG: hypothetical protein WB784_06265 [Rhodanobacteraceae bacterium]
MHSRLRLSARALLAITLAAAGVYLGTPAQAAVLCVNSASSLRSALTIAEGNGVDDTIKIARGTYQAGGSEFYYYATEAHSLDITGGYNSDCSTRIRNPVLTVLDGGGQSSVMIAESTQGAIAIRYLTFQNGLSTGIRGAGLYVNGSNGDNGDVTIGANIFHNNRATSFGGGLDAGDGGTSTLLVRNNLFVGNSAGISDGAAELVSNGVNAYFTNNTVVGNSAEGNGNVNGGVSFGGSATFDISNSVFWSNDGNDLNIDNAVLLDNDYGIINISPPSGSVGNVSVDPLFAGTGDFRLLPTSPLLGVGALFPPGGLSNYDIEGHDRTYRIRVDMGAYERGDTIFDDGYE